MTDTLGPGSLVECVKNTGGHPRLDWILQRLTVGRIYTVTDIFEDYLGHEGLCVEGADPSPYRGWGRMFFRPVRRPDTRLLFVGLAGRRGSDEGPVRSEPVKADAGLAA